MFIHFAFVEENAITGADQWSYSWIAVNYAHQILRSCHEGASAADLSDRSAQCLLAKGGVDKAENEPDVDA